MVAANAVTILMIVFTWIFAVVALGLVGVAMPRQLEARKQRQIARLVTGAEMLADAISRNGHDAVHLARLSANYDAHARALTQLGQAVPPVPAAPAAPLAKAA
ncbi:MAG: hypothetical protein KGQ52_00390 [Alphaproteobacteria bacterium]|nr:hypothetical protein [Alphaproteobacteria bacterium]